MCLAREDGELTLTHTTSECAVYVESCCPVFSVMYRSLYGRYHLRDFNELDHELALRSVYSVMYGYLYTLQCTVSHSQ